MLAGLFCNLGNYLKGKLRAMLNTYDGTFLIPIMEISIISMMLIPMMENNVSSQMFHRV